jgi:glycine dehydrogenase subunit 1
MSVYIPQTDMDRKAMLDRIGLPDQEGLFSGIPAEIRLDRPLKLKKSASEYELVREAGAMAAANLPASEMPCFLGAGGYDRLVPVAVRHLTQRSEFYTAYTPYQPEISQGTLQAIFEFQTMIASLTGMDVANASMYDGATACAEAMLMSVRHTRRDTILISETVHPEVRAVVDTYARFNDVKVIAIPQKGGLTDMAELTRFCASGADTACVLLQSPNFYGLIEGLESASEIAHKAGSLSVSYTADALALALLKSPGASGADIAVGEGQSFGIGMNFGGPYLGFMAAKSALMRKLPGRIVGETVDQDGKRAFVLTLQTREQHIRREKATSNICSNQGLNALTAAIYLSLLGADGLKAAAIQSFDKAHYMCERLAEIGCIPLFEGAYFDEFAASLPCSAEKAGAALLDAGIIGGYALDGMPECQHSGIAGAMLFCVTEKRTKAEIDQLVDVIRTL